MLSAKRFKEKWDTEKNGVLNTFCKKELTKLPFSKNVKTFLEEAGLPSSPPPYLEFVSSTNGISEMTAKYNDDPKLKNFWFLGTTGAGDPICLRGETEEIVYLDRSRNLKIIFMNSSLNQLAETLQAFSAMIEDAMAINGEDAYLDNDIPEEVLTGLKERLKAIDPHSLNAGAFWAVEIEALLC